MDSIQSNLLHVHERIANAAQQCGRDPASITLLAVSKTHNAETIRSAAAAGCSCFGESYVQEAIAKMAPLSDLPLEWHFIGPIQSNKTASIAQHFHWVHSVDREKIARRLHEQRPLPLAPLNVCIQVNISGETTKAGVTADQVEQLARVILGLPRLTLRGLMAIPQPTYSAALETQRQPFRRMRELLEQLNNNLGLQLDTLSMGMSDDLEAAILEGATIIRVGSALFGDRSR